MSNSLQNFVPKPIENPSKMEEVLVANSDFVAAFNKAGKDEQKEFLLQLPAEVSRGLLHSRHSQLQVHLTQGDIEACSALSTKATSNVTMASGYGLVTATAGVANELLADRMLEVLPRIKLDYTPLEVVDFGSSDGRNSRDVAEKALLYASKHGIVQVNFTGVSFETPAAYVLAETLIEGAVADILKSERYKSDNIEAANILQAVLAENTSPIQKKEAKPDPLTPVEEKARNAVIAALEAKYGNAKLIVVYVEGNYYEEETFNKLAEQIHIALDATADHWEQDSGTDVEGFYQANLNAASSNKDIGQEDLSLWRQSQGALRTNISKRLKPGGYCLSAGLIQTKEGRYPADIGYQLLAKAFAKVAEKTSGNASINYDSLFPPAGERRRVWEKCKLGVVKEEVIIIQCGVSSDYAGTRITDNDTRKAVALGLAKVVWSWSESKIRDSGLKTEDVFEALTEGFESWLKDNDVPPEGVLPYDYEFVTAERLGD